MKDSIKECIGFQWDNGNIDKNWDKHFVSAPECEEIFFNQPLFIAVDEVHSEDEKRYFALGRTNFDRYVFLVFTIRSLHIRVISARDMNKKERASYDKKIAS